MVDVVVCSLRAAGEAHVCRQHLWGSPDQHSHLSSVSHCMYLCVFLGLSLISVCSSVSVGKSLHVSFQLYVHPAFGFS